MEWYQLKDGIVIYTNNYKIIFSEHYANLPSERPSITDFRPPNNWPDKVEKLNSILLTILL